MNGAASGPGRPIELIGGIIGRPEWQRFHGRTSRRIPGLCHLVLDDDPSIVLSLYRADLVDEDYVVQIDDADLVLLRDIGPSEEQEAWVVLSRYELPAAHITANLRAPIVLNPSTGRGRQLVQTLAYPMRHILAGLEER